MEGGWGVGGVGAVSFRRWLRGPMLSWVRVGGVGQGHQAYVEGWGSKLS